MDYKNIYAQFINSRLETEPKEFKGKSFSQRRTLAKSNKLDSKGIYENHHIIPKCYGGSDASENIITLLADDHVFAHSLLARIYKGKMIFALNAMLGGSSTSTRSITSKRTRAAYKVTRENFGKEISKMFSSDAEFKEKHRVNTSIKTKEALNRPDVKKRHCDGNRAAQNTPEAKAKRSQITKKTYESQEAKDKASAAMKGAWANPLTRPAMVAAKARAALIRCRKVLNIQTGEIFLGYERAAKSVGVSRKSISAAIKRNGKSGGFSWAFA
jgi:hypothetical protein